MQVALDEAQEAKGDLPCVVKAAGRPGFGWLQGPRI